MFYLITRCTLNKQSHYMPSLGLITHQYKHDKPWSKIRHSLSVHSMGCGPSHFGISYSRKNKKKKNKHKESGNVYISYLIFKFYKKFDLHIDSF